MTVQELFALKSWQVAHRMHQPVEFHAWDVMLTFWLMGWMGMPAALVLWQPVGMAVCLLLFCAPTAYVHLRLHLHERRYLRCDWSQVVNGSVQEPRR